MSTALTASPKSAASFDYSTVPAATATALRAQALRINGFVKTHTTAVIEAGLDLIAVKQHLRRGQFGHWVASECGFSIATAENFMRAAKFAEGRIAIITIFLPTTLYKLAAKSTPSEIADAFVRRAEQGEKVSDRDVTLALEEVRFKRSEAERAEKKERKRPSKRTEAKWEKIRRAEQDMQDMAAQQRRQAIAELVEAIGLNNARLVVDALQGGVFGQDFDELKRACHADCDGGAV
jgi:hypothetical protein